MTDEDVIHVTPGDRGKQGDKGDTGDPGPPFSSWITRHVLVAYLLLAIGVFLSFVVSVTLNERALREIDHRAKENCEAGNERSRLQIEALTDSQKRLEALDLTQVLGTAPDQVDNVRRLSRETYERRVASWPFLDCDTGKRIPPIAPLIP